ncbi:MAG: hypothetical protein HY899_19995 [Deltaproteobacteria bacterium]|nr:hypothetical protein [Deltaproteobacteria bacterium]
MLRYVRMFFVLALVAFATTSFAQTYRVIYACGTGTYNAYQPYFTLCPPGGCVGNMLTCPEGNVYLSGSATLTYLKGVCGDQPGAVPCGSDLTYYYENCGKPVSTITNGDLTNARSWAKWRICAGGNDCLTPTGKFIGGSAISFGSHMNDLAGGEAIVNEHLREGSIQSFTFNGNTISSTTVAFRWGSGHYLGEPVVVPSTTCPTGMGCGFAGCLLKVR